MYDILKEIENIPNRKDIEDSRWGDWQNMTG